MAKKNPTDHGSAVVLTFSAAHLRLLRPLLEMVRNGIREELETHADTLREPARLRREEEAWVNLLAALTGGGEVVPGRELGRVVAELGASIDAANEYSRVVAEHDAVHALLAQVGRPDGAAA